MAERLHLAVLNTHPTQYFAPLYRFIAAAPDIDLIVYYCSRQGTGSYTDAGFEREVRWDTDLLNGYRHEFLPNLRSRDRVAGWLTLVNPSIVRRLRERLPDALWIHGHAYVTALLAVAAARKFHIPLMMRCETHLQLKRNRVKRLLRRALMPRFYRLFGACLPIGRLNRDFYRSNGVPEDRLFDVPYTVDNGFFSAAVGTDRRSRQALRKKYELPPHKPLILFAGKLIDRKRPSDALSAFEMLRSRGTEAALAIVGSGPLQDSLEQRARGHRIPDVHFLGFRNQGELPHLYAAADVFVFPSVDEPWGLVLNEVMCAGLPVVAYRDIGATADLIREGWNGYIVAPGDVDGLAARLSDLVRDRELRERMGAASRNIMTRWGFEEDLRGIQAALAVVARERQP